jgi:hypothetical protein
MEQLVESQGIKYAFYHSCDECGIQIPSKSANADRVLGGHRKYCQATFEGKRQREEAVIGDEELRMMNDDFGVGGSWCGEEEFATSEHDEGIHIILNRDFDSENGDLIEEENDDGSNHNSGDEDSVDEKEEPGDEEEDQQEREDEEEEEGEQARYCVDSFFVL